MAHTLVRWENGQASIQDEEGRAMHSRIGPESEAREIYVNGSQLRESLLRRGPDGILTLYDIGLGIASNALATLEEVERLRKEFPAHAFASLRIESFESRPDALRTALEESSPEDPAFAWLHRHREKIETLLNHRRWAGNGIEWNLHEGDFEHRLRQLSPDELPPADLIYFDFYAPKTCPQLWSPELFTRLRTRCHPESGALLITYSSATPVRVALLLAGFFIGAGAATNAKLETTIAATKKERLPEHRLLGERWLDKLERSTSPLPYAWDSPELEGDLRAIQEHRVRDRIASHPQFKDFYTTG